MKKIQISIPKPCHENWNGMTPDNKGRFCASCQKTVIDFSTMSDRQLAEFFKKPAGSVCGRFHQDQLEREIDIPKKRIPWVKYFFTVALPAFLVSCKFAGRQSLQGKAIAVEQHTTGDTVAVTQIPFIKGEVPTLPKDRAFVSERQSPLILMGDIMLPQIDSDRGSVKATPVKNERICRCKVQAITSGSNAFVRPPFSFQPTAININEIRIDKPRTEDFYVTTVGAVSVSKTYRSRMPKNNFKLSEIAVKKQIPASFLIYPNPMKVGAAFILDGKNLEGGLYQLAIVNTAGQIIQAQELMLQSKVSKEIIQLRSVSAGVYFVELANKKGRVFSKKLLVQ